MIFSSAEFIFLFLPGTLLLYYSPLFRGRRARNVLLVLVSLFFYAWGEPWFVLVMIGSILANYLLGLWMARARERTAARRLVTAAAITVGEYLFPVSFCTTKTGRTPPCSLPTTGERSA